LGSFLTGTAIVWFPLGLKDTKQGELTTIAHTEHGTCRPSAQGCKADADPDLDTLREGVWVMTQALMELEVAQHLGAQRYQRSPDRQVNGRATATATGILGVGTLELRVPWVRDGSYLPGLLEPRKRAERALVATVREAYVQGVSTRRVDNLFVGGVSKHSYGQFRSMCVSDTLTGERSPASIGVRSLGF